MAVAPPPAPAPNIIIVKGGDYSVGNFDSSSISRRRVNSRRTKLISEQPSTPLAPAETQPPANDLLPPIDLDPRAGPQQQYISDLVQQGLLAAEPEQKPPRVYSAALPRVAGESDSNDNNASGSARNQGKNMIAGSIEETTRSFRLGGTMRDSSEVEVKAKNSIAQALREAESTRKKDPPKVGESRH